MTEEASYPCTDADLDRYLSTCVELVRQAGAMINAAVAGTRKPQSVANKSENASEGHASSVLTQTDAAVERHLIDGLRDAFGADHRFIGEETRGAEREYSNRPTWIIDPIDGTMNFVHRTPLVCTSVALAVNRRVVLGVVNDPRSGRLFSAIKGRGAFLEERADGDDGKTTTTTRTKLATSAAKSLEEAMVLMELPAGANPVKRGIAVENVAALLPKVQAVRCPGPAALDISWVGAGFAEAFFHFSIHCWDMAAGALIVKEAGGEVLGPDGQEFDLMGRGCLVAASAQLAHELAAIIKVYKVDERDYPEKCPL